MTVLSVLRWPDARLRLLATQIDGITPAIRSLAQDMLDTMYAAQGRGLAAPQVGVLQRLFVMDTDWKSGEPSPQVFLNPQILWASDVTANGPEGCLSIGGPAITVRRSQSIRLGWTGLDGKDYVQRFSGFAAICIQHEIDHLNGVLILDYLEGADRIKAEGLAA